MELNWLIVFIVLLLGFIIIPGIVFLSHHYRNQKNNQV